MGKKIRVGEIYDYFADEILHLIGDDKEVELFIRSDGGYFIEAMQFIEEIKKLKEQGLKLTTIANDVYSAGSVVALAGDVRKAYKNSVYQIHSVSGDIYGDVDDVEEYAKSLKECNTILRDFIAERTTATKEQIEEWLQHDTTLSGEELLQYGFVHELIEKEKKDKDYFINKTKKVMLNFFKKGGKPKNYRVTTVTGEEIDNGAEKEKFDVGDEVTVNDENGKSGNFVFQEGDGDTAKKFKISIEDGKVTEIAEDVEPEPTEPDGGAEPTNSKQVEELSKQFDGLIDHVNKLIGVVNQKDKELGELKTEFTNFKNQKSKSANPNKDNITKEGNDGGVKKVDLIGRENLKNYRK